MATWFVSSIWLTPDFYFNLTGQSPYCRGLNTTSMITSSSPTSPNELARSRWTIFSYFRGWMNTRFNKGVGRVNRRVKFIARKTLLENKDFAPYPFDELYDQICFAALVRNCWEFINYCYLNSNICNSLLMDNFIFNL